MPNEKTKVKWRGPIPQIEWGRKWSNIIGGTKTLMTRSQFVLLLYTSLNTALTTWAVSDTVRQLFRGNVALYILSIAAGGVAMMLFVFIVMLSADITFGRQEIEDSDRSPLKSDTEQILDRLDELEERIE